MYVFFAIIFTLNGLHIYSTGTVDPFTFTCRGHPLHCPRHAAHTECGQRGSRAINPFNPEFTIIIFIHYKPRMAVATLDL